MELTVASNNRGKLAEYREILGPLGFTVYSQSEKGIHIDVEETGTTFEENALLKARAVHRQTGGWVISDDSGLQVDALGGAPGIYSARYSGEGANDVRNREKLLEELAGVPEAERTARFVCTAALVLPADSPVTVPEQWRIPEELAEKRGLDPRRAAVVRGECEGLILSEERGDGGFGYDPLFFYPEFGATFAEIPGERKNLVSHRGRAMRVFAARLAAILKE